ncbi:MAG: 3-phenylpropionate/cinnamic acid dioxygenase small subunit [Gammaproteobacteria bacterium]|jgi:3-phenylpropionate/cinnamic acid dioxygenase small subunit
MTDLEANQIATTLLGREGSSLDDHAWDEWLALYDAHAVYWVPAWRDEANETTDPNNEISQIYHADKSGLQERVARIRSGKSVTAMPLPRTTHFTTNIVAKRVSHNEIEVRSNWMVQVYQPRTTKQYVNFGHYELTLTQASGGWLIEKKITHLKNDLVPALIDFYTL